MDKSKSKLKNKTKNKNKIKKAKFKKSSISYLARNPAQSEQFTKSINKILHVSYKSAAIQAAEFFDNQNNQNNQNNQQLSTSNLLLLNSPDFPADLLDQYCNKTGRLLRKRPANEFYHALNVLSIEQLADRLQLQYSDHYALEWLDTSPENLRKLSQTDPIGYFIYTAGLLYQFDIDWITDETVKLDTRNNFLKQKITAYKELTNLQTDEKTTINQIIVCNELLRKLIGLIKPANLRKFARFNCGSITSWTASVENLKDFQLAIQETIKAALLKHFKSVRQSRIEKFEKDRKVKYIDLEALRKKMGGLSNFHRQPKLKNCNEHESILFDLFGVLDLENEFNDEFDDLHIEAEGAERSEGSSDIIDLSDDGLSDIDFSSVKITNSSNSAPCARPAPLAKPSQTSISNLASLLQNSLVK